MRQYRSHHSFVRRSLVVGLAILPVLLAGLQHEACAAVPRIVCIGEQTTQTAEMSPTWPTKMQTDLGAAFVVTNDGDGNATVLAGSKAGHTYSTPSNAPYKDSINAPDIVVIGPWAEHDEIAVKAGADATHFQTDYDALVTSYLSLPKKPCVIVTTPVVISTYQQNPATDLLVTNTIEPAVLAVAQAHSLKIVDLYTAFMNQAAWLGPDGHFTAAGAAQVASMVETALSSCSSTGTGGAGGAGGSSGAAGSSGAPSAAGSGGAGAGSAGLGGSSGAETAASAGAGAGGASVAAGGTSSAGASGSAVSIAGAAGTVSVAGGAGAAASAPASSDSSGCAFVNHAAPRSAAGLLALLGGALLLRRRQRNH